MIMLNIHADRFANARKAANRHGRHYLKQTTADQTASAIRSGIIRKYNEDPAKYYYHGYSPWTSRHYLYFRAKPNMLWGKRWLVYMLAIGASWVLIILSTEISMRWTFLRSKSRGIFR
jgi:hypothetical protein